MFEIQFHCSCEKTEEVRGGDVLITQLKDWDVNNSLLPTWNSRSEFSGWIPCEAAPTESGICIMWRRRGSSRRKRRRRRRRRRRRESRRREEEKKKGKKKKCKKSKVRRMHFSLSLFAAHSKTNSSYFPTPICCSIYYLLTAAEKMICMTYMYVCKKHIRSKHTKTIYAFTARL